jgi:hypothetical protein
MSIRPSPHTTSNSTTKSDGLYLQVTVDVWNQVYPPVGLPPPVPGMPPIPSQKSIPDQENFDRGNARVDFVAENHSEKTLTLNIQQVEVQSLDNQVLLSLRPEQRIRSMRLEPSQNGTYYYQLRRKQDFGQHRQVKAIIVYLFEGRQYRAESPVTTVR